MNCRVGGPIGHGRQAWYEAQKRSDQRQTQQQSILAEVKRIREKHPKVGAQKLYFQLRGWCEQNGVKIGRDKFLNLLRTNGLMIYRMARKAITTNSKHDFYRYPNLVKGIKVTGPNQLWPGRPLGLGHGKKPRIGRLLAVNQSGANLTGR